MLRGEASEVVPTDFKTEDLALLVTRVLYRLRFQSDKQPFDSSTFSMSAPLLSRCIASEGLGVEKGDNDAAMEQLALVIDVMAFHVRQCEVGRICIVLILLMWLGLQSPILLFLDWLSSKVLFWRYSGTHPYLGSQPMPLSILERLSPPTPRNQSWTLF